MSASSYDKIKFIAQIVLPGLGTLYFTLASLWGLPSAEEVIGTLAAIGIFLGVILQYSSSQYKKNGPDAYGTLALKQVGDKTTYHLELDGDPEYELEGKDRVIFRVEKAPPKRRRRAPKRPA